MKIVVDSQFVAELLAALSDESREKIKERWKVEGSIIGVPREFAKERYGLIEYPRDIQ